MASFFYHLFESLIILPRLQQTFSSAFCVVSPNFVTSYTRARGDTAHDRKALPGPAVYSFRRFFLKFLRIGIKSCNGDRNDSLNYRGRYLGCASRCMQKCDPNVVTL